MMKDLTLLNRQQLLDTMQTFAIAFDIVRIVEPERTTVMTFDGEVYKEAQFEPCFAVWEKEERCENCISLRVCFEKHKMSKFEFRGEEVYNVISVPILVQENNKQHVVALELVNRISEDTIFQATGDNRIAQEIHKLNRRAYEDSLTSVYNRRYFDENRHIFELNHQLPEKVGYIIIDVDRFKYVNDTYGHACGDELLVAVANVLKQHVRQTDKLMRIGGDEFLLMLRNCSLLLAERKIVQLKNAVSAIQLSWMQDYTPSISAGLSYTDTFSGSPEQLRELFDHADHQMYLDKSKPMVQKKTLLIVDDIDVNRALLTYTFKEDFNILEARDGIEALAILKTNIVEIVITDIYMPGMDGLTLTKKIRKDPELAKISVFVITERGEQHELDALSSGADDFINKPFNPELLRHRMKGVLAQNTVFNRINQYQLSFNQNQIAFATVRIDGDQIIYQYVNDAFSQLVGGTPDDFISGRKQLHLKGLDTLLMEVNHTKKRTTMTTYDEATDSTYDIIAYAQELGFCSFIIFKL